MPIRNGRKLAPWPTKFFQGLERAVQEQQTVPNLTEDNDRRGEEA